MRKSNYQLIIGLAIGLVVGILAGRQLFRNTDSKGTPPLVVHQDNQPVTNSVNPAQTGNEQRDARIPQKVFVVLKYIRAHGQAMPGYVGGRIFSNREEELPREDNNGKPVLYHEWDVNPKVEGENRGTERIITGSDGRAWYTTDHYRSFREIK